MYSERPELCAPAFGFGGDGDSGSVGTGGLRIPSGPFIYSIRQSPIFFTRSAARTLTYSLSK
ncbi:hypothetical protein JOD21_003045 [Jeotgalibacillus terrae]|nr:hypothetical protein [Jeotgalibacillus terrae]